MWKDSLVAPDTAYTYVNLPQATEIGKIVKQV